VDTGRARAHPPHGARVHGQRDAGSAGPSAAGARRRRLAADDVPLASVTRRLGNGGAAARRLLSLAESGADGNGRDAPHGHARGLPLHRLPRPGIRPQSGRRGSAPGLDRIRPHGAAGAGATRAARGNLAGGSFRLGELACGERLERVGAGTGGSDRLRGGADVPAPRRLPGALPARWGKALWLLPLAVGAGVAFGNEVATGTAVLGALLLVPPFTVQTLQLQARSKRPRHDATWKPVAHWDHGLDPGGATRGSPCGGRRALALVGRGDRLLGWIRGGDLRHVGEDPALSHLAAPAAAPRPPGIPPTIAAHHARSAGRPALANARARRCSAPRRIDLPRTPHALGGAGGDRLRGADGVRPVAGGAHLPPLAADDASAGRSTSLDASPG